MIEKKEEEEEEEEEENLLSFFFFVRIWFSLDFFLYLSIYVFFVVILND